MAEFQCNWSIAGFTAGAVYTGENRLVDVTGHGLCPREDFTVQLVADPDFETASHSLRLTVVETAPEVGLQVETETSTSFFSVVSEAKEVIIDGLGTIRVAEPTDP